MSNPLRPAVHRPLLAALITGTLVASSAAVAPAAQRSSAPTGGAPIGGLAPNHASQGKVPSPPGKHAHGKWLTGVTITEYWPAPERWFVGGLVSAPGLSGKHRIDWLYCATGVSMEGDGIGLDGRQLPHRHSGRRRLGHLGGQVHVAERRLGGRRPVLARRGLLEQSLGGASRSRCRPAAGTPAPAAGMSRCGGSRSPPDRPCRCSYYQSIAVDPSVMPLGSRVYIPAYRGDGHGGWFIAQDTGGAINGRHIDVYRTPPPSPNDGGQYLTGQRLFVVKPSHG